MGSRRPATPTPGSTGKGPRPSGHMAPQPLMPIERPYDHSLSPPPSSTPSPRKLRPRGLDTSLAASVGGAHGNFKVVIRVRPPLP
ncbi:unnamed protein product, partial [Chrysoparadoxa australica]